MLHLLLGRARTGKSEYILQKIRDAKGSAEQILLVPEHASHVAEVDLCRACGKTASSYAEVLTFKSLASRVLSIVGGAADFTLDGGGKLLTMQSALQELAPQLRVFCHPSQRSAFLEQLLAAMEELQAYAVSPEDLADKVEQIEGDTGDKLHDIALLYGIYTAKLHENGRDARDRLEKLAEHLAESHYVDGKEIYLDGFSYFTGREKTILQILLRHAKEVTVTLLADEADRELFAESLRVRDELRAMAEKMGVSCKEKTLPPSAPNDALSCVERGFFRGDAVWNGAAEEICLHEAGTRYAECEWAAAEILRLVREENYRFREITVTARNQSEYLSTLQTVFARYGVPIYCNVRSDMMEKPVISLICGVLDAISGGMEYEDMFRFLKTGYAGLSAEECDILENYVLTWDIRGAMWTRKQDWTAHPDGYGAPETDESIARLAKVNELRLRVGEPLSVLAEGLRAEKTSEGKVRALYRYLEAVFLHQSLENEAKQLYERGDEQGADETAQLWCTLCDVMDQFVEILGSKEIDTEEFTRLFRLILTQYSVGTIPMTLDAVNCGNLTRNDRHTVRALFLLGANDGVLPNASGETGILKEEERLALEGREIYLAPHGAAQFQLEMQNIYAAVAQPTDRLYVSYPTAGSGSEELRPSFLIGRLRKLCPNATLEKESPDKEFRLSAKKTALEYAGSHIGGAAWQYFAARGDCTDQLDAMKRASNYTRGKLSPEAVRALYHGDLHLSASRIDKARACHFAYFMQYGLRAKNRESAAFAAPQQGTFIHDVMEQTLKEAHRQGGIKELGREKMHELVRAAIDRYIAENLPRLDEETPRFRYLFNRLRESAYRIMDEVCDELTVSDFTPIAFELSFGGKSDDDLPAIRLYEEKDCLHVVGKVDRVDGWVHGGKLYLRVVDYKTGKKSFDLAELRYGLGIQMLLYLFALQEEGAERFSYEIVPAGVLYMPARQPLLPMERGASEEKIATAMKKELRRSGMVLDEPEVLQAMEHTALSEPRYLPIKLKKDGTISEGVASAEQLGKLGKYVDRLLREMFRELKEGNIDADPYVHGEYSACTYCEFSAACHFDEKGCGNDHLEYIRRTGAEDFWKHVDATIGKEGKA